MQSLNRFFQDFVAAKAGKLVAESHLAKAIEHNGLKGAFREYTLGNFIRDFLPITHGIGSGSIQDSLGTQSPESDVIIWQQDLLPPALFSSEKGVFPIEACRYWFEVKSTVSRQEIINSIAKAKKVLSLMPLENYDPPLLPRIIPVFFAYNSDVSDPDELKRFIEVEANFYGNPCFAAICIVGKGYWTYAMSGLRSSNKPQWMVFPSDENHYEIVSLLAGILNTLSGRNRPSFGYYIMNPEKDCRGKIL